MTAKVDRATIGLDDVAGVDVLNLTRDDRFLHVEILVWSCAHSTDGLLPSAALRRVTDHPDAEAGCAALVAAGKLEAIDGGWQVVGFGDEQLSREWKAKLRASGRAKQAAWRDRRLGIRDGGTPVNNSVTYPVNNRVRTSAQRSVARGTRSGPLGGAAARRADAAHHKGDPTPCPQCDKTLRSPQGLKIHVRHAHPPRCAAEGCASSPTRGTEWCARHAHPCAADACPDRASWSGGLCATHAEADRQRRQAEAARELEELRVRDPAGYDREMRARNKIR